MSAGRALRDALEAYMVGEGQALLQRLRDPQDRGVPESRRQGRWLGSERGREAFQEARERDLLPAAALDRLEQQRDQVAHLELRRAAELGLERDLGQLTGDSGQALHVREQLGRIATASDERRRATAGIELDRALRAPAERWVAACMEAERPLLRAREPSGPQASPPQTRSAGGLLIVSSLEQALAQPEPGAAPVAFPEEAWTEAATAFLAETDDAVEDAVRFCARELSTQFPLPWTAWLRGLRAPELDSETGARQRWRRVAAWLRAQGFERELGAHVRAEVEAAGVLPLARLALPAVPRDVRVAQPPPDWGVASDLFAAEGVGRATALCLTLPTLPPELRWPLPGCMAEAVGGLSAQLWGDRGHLRSVQGMATAEAERVGRQAATLALVCARFACGVAVAGLDAVAKPEARAEALAEVAARAMGCDLPASLAGLIGGDRAVLRARGRGWLAGLALHAALRERYDEDWYRNPRAGEPLRAACGRGNGVPAERLLEELGGSLALAAGRACELLT